MRAVGDAGEYGDSVPPLAIVALGLTSLQAQLSLPEGSLHTGQEVEQRAAVSAGTALTLSGRIAQRSERQGFVISVIEFDVASPAGQVVSARTTIMAPGPAALGRVESSAAGGGAAADSAIDSRDVAPAEMSEGRVERTITQEQLLAYADASGDHNPIHVDPAFAAGTMFGGTIAHGMLVLALIGEAMHDITGDEWLSSGRLKVRFKAPTRPGDTVAAAAASAEASKAGEWAVSCVSQRGEVLVEGRAFVGQ